MHPAIRLTSVSRLGGPSAPAAPPPVAGRARGVLERAGGKVLDRIGRTCADANGPETRRAEMAALRAELAATRAELLAEIELLRAEIETSLR